ncbi:MAG TPA: hypothetical protein DCM05_05330 [Elusimicrobia bacterium]|nr:hypothetical protein [Elusimicrobiota bacterium]
MSELIKESVQKQFFAKFESEPDLQGKVEPLFLEVLRVELLKPGATTKAVLIEGCHGALSGLLLAGKDVRACAVDILKAVALVVQERSGDPMTTMGYALEGIARIAPAVHRDTVAQIANEIDSAFMGAGETFSAFASKYQPKS